MLCPYCKHKTEVTNSRHKATTNQVWRRRSCPHCSGIFSSLETPDLSTSIIVTSHGKSKPFDTDGLFISIYESMRHRNAAHHDARAICDTVINKLLKDVQNASIERDEIVSTTATTLQRFDRAASVQYLAFHPKNK